MSATKLTADEVMAVVDGLGETGSAWLKVDDLGNGGLYSKREENADTRFHGTVADVAEARAVLNAPNHTPWPTVALRKQSSSTEAWASGCEVHLREPGRASFVHTVDLYGGPEITGDNFDSPEVVRQDRLARLRAGQLAKRWRDMPYEEALAEYDAL